MSRIVLITGASSGYGKATAKAFKDNGDTVMFAPAGSMYGTAGKGVNEIRIAYILKQEDLERAMDLLALGIKAYNEASKLLDASITNGVHNKNYVARQKSRLAKAVNSVD